MGIGNDNTTGARGKTNFDWQLRMLKLEAEQLSVSNNILIALGGGAGSATFVGPITDVGPGTIPANVKSYAIANVGVADGIVNGGNLPKDLEISFAAQDGASSVAAIPYDASGTTFIITYIL